jgi:SAM-dependent methyltransferase
MNTGASAPTAGRVYGEVVDIDYQSTLEFFEGRATGARSSDALTTVLYQDAHPEVAEARHAFEVERVSPHLGLERLPTVLDVGCGNGRWARALSCRVGTYLGVDFSSSLLEQARKAVAPQADAARFRFQVLSATDLDTAALAVDPPFGLVVSAGILIYLNDQDVAKVIRAYASLTGPGSVVYLREPVAVSERLTLAHFPSEELHAEYSAVYRPASHYRDLIEREFRSGQFEFVVDEPLGAELSNRAETTQHYFVFRRRSR